MRFFPPTLIFLSLLQLAATAEIPPISLAGEWRFQLDPEKIGVNALWPHRALSDTILLPGTTDENKKGILTDYRPMDRLARVWDWKGAAWYQRDITIPSSWRGKRIAHFLERTKHSHLWVNGSFWDEFRPALINLTLTLSTDPFFTDLFSHRHTVTFGMRDFTREGNRLLVNARPIILDDTPHDYRPTLQVIDNFDRNHKLGLIFETKVGTGSLLVCAIDLPALQDKPEARQLLHSLQQYISSPAFTPKNELDPAILKKLFT